MKAIKIIRDAEAFQILADETRRKMIYLLRAKEMTVSQLASELNLTPQAIYHHIRKLKNADLVEVAREERVDHFIETYYRATAEVFHIAHGNEKNKSVELSQSKSALEAMTKLGFVLECREEAAEKLVNIQRRMFELGKCSEWDDKIGEMEDVDFFGKQAILEYAQTLAMKDEEFDEYIDLYKQMRKLLRSCLTEQSGKRKKS